MTKQAFVSLALLACAAGAHAATAQLAVTGTITPGACAVTLGNGGTVDYGAMSTVTVKGFPKVGNTYQHPRIGTVVLNVSCASPTAVALAWTDNKAASRLPVDGNDAIRFGLGVYAGSNIGAYDIDHAGLRISTTATGTLGEPAGRLTRAKGTTGAWTTATGLVNFADPHLEVGFKTAAADTVPPAISRISGNLTFGIYFSKALVDAATGSITLDGSTTVSLVYI